MFKEIPANKMSLSRRKLVQGVGVNDADYIVHRKINGKVVSCPFYLAWLNMIKRCFSKEYKSRNQTYKDCSVCEEWLTFSNFKNWMSKQNWQGNQLDKDILIQGNKLYSPETCIFIPSQINTLLVEQRKGVNPKGVYSGKSGSFNVRCRNNGKSVHVGTFKTKELAFEAYKEYKYNLIKSVALKQAEPLKTALLNYRI